MKILALPPTQSLAKGEREMVAEELVGSGGAYGNALRACLNECARCAFGRRDGQRAHLYRGGRDGQNRH
eukprot:2942776-Prymnesium_polylepis.2